ncbi:8918_t:CDS:2, partial [Dentiscutata erythropus]
MIESALTTSRAIVKIKIAFSTKKLLYIPVLTKTNALLMLQIIDSSRTSDETTELPPTEANTETRSTKKSRTVELVETDTHPVNTIFVDNQNASTTQTQSRDSSLPPSKCSVTPKIEATTIVGENLEKENKYFHSTLPGTPLLPTTVEEILEKLELIEKPSSFILPITKQEEICPNPNGTFLITTLLLYEYKQQLTRLTVQLKNPHKTTNRQNTIDKIKIINYNIQGLNNDIKLQKWLEYCHEEEIQIIVMTETKLLQFTASRKTLSNPLYEIYTANNDVDYAVNREASLDADYTTRSDHKILLTEWYMLSTLKDDWTQFTKQIRENLKSSPISSLSINDRKSLNRYTNIWYSIVKQAAKDNIPSTITAPKVFHAHSFKATQLHRGLKVANKTLALFKSIHPPLTPDYTISQINKKLKTLSDLTGIPTSL